MKKFVSMLCAFLGLFMIGFTVQPSSTAQASEKTYVIDTDVTFPPFVYANEDNKYVGIDMDFVRLRKRKASKLRFVLSDSMLPFNRSVPARRTV